MTYYLDKVQQCPICDSRQIEASFAVSYWMEHRFQFFDCRECFASFVNPMPSDQLISKGNNALVRYLHQNRTSEQEFRDARQAYLRGKLFAKKLRKFKKKGRFLELGCFHGFFSLGVQENSDWEVEGLEISSELTEFIKKKLNLTCHLGTVEETDLPQAAYDFVLCHDLIEHINQPKKFLTKLSSILAPKGQVQIITPNGIQDLAFLRRAYQRGVPISVILNHIMYFTPNTLKRGLESVGISIQKLYCYDVRYALHDFGWFGMGQPKSPPTVPALESALQLEEKEVLSFWTPERLGELRQHPKTSLRYGWIKETLPHFFTLKVPYQLGIGHEIYALGVRKS